MIPVFTFYIFKNIRLFFSCQQTKIGGFDKSRPCVKKNVGFINQSPAIPFYLHKVGLMNQAPTLKKGTSRFSKMLYNY